VVSLTKALDIEPKRFEVAIDDSAFGREPAATVNGGRLLTTQEAADYCACHYNTVNLASKRGELRTHRIGRLPRFTVEDLHDWMRRR
jgi:excisionase family DNA binding protein